MTRNVITGAKPRTSKWKITLGGMYSYMIWSSVGRCYAVFYEPLLQQFDSNYAGISQINALTFIGSTVSALITPNILRCFGYRKVLMTLSFFGAISVFIGSFSNNFTLLTFFIGLIPGFCLSACFNTYVMLAAKFSDKISNFIAQLICLGGAIGPFATCPLFQILVDEYGWRGALQIFSGFVLNLMVAGATILPDLPLPKNITTLRNGSIDTSEVNPSAEASNTSGKSNPGKCCQRNMSKVNSLLHLELLASISFWAVSISHAASYTSYVVCTAYIITFAYKGLGLSEILAATLICGLSVGDAVSKALHGILYAKLTKLQRFIEVALSNALLAIFLIVTPLTTGYTTLMLLCTLLGLAGGGLLGDYVIMMKDVFPVEIYHYTCSYVCVIVYLSMAGTQVLTGLAIDRTGDPATALYIGAGLAFLSALWQIPLVRKIK